MNDEPSANTSPAGPVSVTQARPLPGLLGTVDRLSDRVSQLLKYAAAALLIVVAVLIAIDVIARSALNIPLIGVAEIVANSLVLIAFLQLSYTVRIDGMLRSEALDGPLGRSGRIVVRILACLLGALLFILIAWSSWEGMINAFQSGEFEGHASFKVPTYPVRTAIVVFSIGAAFNYLLLALRTLLTGELSSAPVEEFAGAP